MEEVSENEKRGLKHKLLEFQKTGLLSYGRYLDNELENSKDKTNRRAYTRYIEQEIDRNKKKLEEIEETLR